MILLTQSRCPLPHIGAVKIFAPKVPSKGAATYLIELDNKLFYVRKKANLMWVDNELGSNYPDELIDFISNLIDNTKV